MATPWLHAHYRRFSATTDGSAPVPRIGTQMLAGPPLASLPCHRGDRFPRSTQKPAHRSRHLHAGRRLDSKSVVLQPYPRITTTPWFRRHSYAFDTSSAVHLRSSSMILPDRVMPDLFRIAHHEALLTPAACGGLGSAPISRSRGAIPHLSCSTATTTLPVQVMATSLCLRGTQSSA
jgi:hypothetical protein